MPDRVIFHADCNSFYASVELLKHPELRGKPVAVSGSEDSRHGIILAKNDAAKKFNVQTAETVWQARRKCPALILLPPHHAEYSRYYRIINDIYAEYTDRVQPFGIDESWLDMTGSWQLFGPSPLEVAHRLRHRVSEQTGLTVSVGVSFNKVFAKLGSDYKKPDAVTEITRENFQQVLWPCPVDTLLFVGAKTREALGELGIKTIGELAAASPALLKQVLGKHGLVLHAYAAGEDEEPVLRADEREAVKSVGNGLTFRRNLAGHRDMRTALGSLADEVAGRLRKEGLYAASLQLTIKDPDLKVITRQKPLPFATNLARDLVAAGMELLEENWDFARPVRMLTVTAQQLCDTPFAVQTSLFEAPPAINPKTDKLERSVDTIRSRFGRHAILNAGELNNDIGLDAGAHAERQEGGEDA